MNNLLRKVLSKINQGYLNLMISNEEIEIFADYLAEKSGRNISNPYFDVDAYIEFDLELPLFYKKLSNNYNSLGMIILAPGNVMVYENDIEKYENFATIGSIIIDSDACKIPARERFTKAHELGHYYFDLPRYLNPNNKELINNIECHIDEKNYCDISWEEKRANKFASCILMPRSIFKIDFENYLANTFYITRALPGYRNGVNLNFISAEEREKVYDVIATLIKHSK